MPLNTYSSFVWFVPYTQHHIAALCDFSFVFVFNTWNGITVPEVLIEQILVKWQKKTRMSKLC